MQHATQRAQDFSPLEQGLQFPRMGTCRTFILWGGAVGMTERRTARRYDLSLPVNVRLPINREPAAHNGQTRDISTRGVYFMMQKDLAPGTEVDFTLTLPAEITRGAEVFVRAHGRVVRVDKQQDDQHESIGVAAVIERYDIIRGEGTPI
jgi:hypothetical protein